MDPASGLYNLINNLAKVDFPNPEVPYITTILVLLKSIFKLIF